MLSRQGRDSRRASLPQLVFSTLASAYNGLIANPLFTGVLGTELISDPEARTRTLPANLIGGSIGYLIFFGAGYAAASRTTCTCRRAQAFAPIDIVLVVIFALLGLGPGVHRRRSVPRRGAVSSVVSRVARWSGR